MKKKSLFCRLSVLFAAISAFFTDTVLAVQNIPAADFIDNPITGDDGKYLLWLGLVIIFVIAIIRIITLNKKK